MEDKKKKPTTPPPPIEVETDVTTLERRQKQIDYGKNTEEYLTYAKTVPRQLRQPFHPKTPNKSRKYSRRAWDGLVRQWRVDLHCWSSSKRQGTKRSASLQKEDDVEGCDTTTKGDCNEVFDKSSSTSPGDVDSGSRSFSTSWADEVEEEYYSQENNETSFKRQRLVSSNL